MIWVTSKVLDEAGALKVACVSWRATVERFYNGTVFDGLVEEIKRAKKSIHVVLYIWEKGAASDRVSAALVERAKAGVRCAILVDDLGSPDFEKTVGPSLVQAGCEVRIFRPMPSTDKLARNHRKIVIVDGVTTFTGGVGIRDSWLGDGVQGEGWRDSNVRFSGPAASEAQQAFAENWQEAGGALLPADDFPAPVMTGEASAAFISSTNSSVVTRAERLTQLLIASAKKRLSRRTARTRPSCITPSDGIDLRGA
ncbi:MAG: phospholipase D-like domain-containing protein [Polyangiaceae bacterium]